MLKSILKMVYITFGAIMCFIIYSLSYSTNVQNKIISTVRSSVNSGDRLDVAQVFSMPKLPLDSEPFYNQKIDGVGEVVIYNTVSLIDIVTYKNEGTEEKPDWDPTEEKYYENMYYMFIFNPLFTYTSGSDVNNSGIRFYCGDSYIDYHFVVSNKEGEDNYEEYIKRPQNKFESIYNSKRDLTGNYSEFGLIFVPFTQTIINETVNKLSGSSINKISILSHDINDSTVAKEVGVIEKNFDFSQQFYQDLEEYVDNRNKAMNGDSSEIKKNAKDFIKDFDVTTLNANYIYGYSNSKIYSKSLIWNAVGIVALFIVVLILVYILVFHFQFIKGIIFRQPKSKQRYVPNKLSSDKNNQNKKSADGRVDVNAKPEKQISAAHSKRKENSIDAKVDVITPKENSKPASDVDVNLDVKTETVENAELKDGNENE